MNQQAMGGIPHDVMPGNNNLMQKVNNDQFATPEDGIVKTAA